MKDRGKYCALKFESVFAVWARDYIAQNRALGYKYNFDAEYLMQFDDYCVRLKVETPALTTDLLDGWCEKRAYETDTSQHIRIRVLRRFSRFLHDNGVEAPTKFHPLPNVSKTFEPYIFTRDEISRFLAAADEIEGNAHSPLAHLVMPLLFRMLYCCGLRLSEALCLKNEDVDLNDRTLRIMDAKGGKDRFVPMSGSLTRLCVSYRSDREVAGFGSEYFFPSTDRGRYSSATIYTRYRKILWSAGISHGGRGKGPRLHDLRHTFAVHTLDNWAASGKDLYVALPILSTYLGHKTIYETQSYLRLVPGAHAALTQTFERGFGSVFPGVAP